jgi:CHASE2 domain-containing sensor protein
LPWTFTPAGNLQLGSREFPRLPSRIGGYAGIDAGGNQILLNYRQARPAFDQVSLRQILNGEVSPSAIQDRIVLIGYTGKGVNDYAATPAGNLPGVVIHAHMISQILSAVQNHRALLWSPPRPFEIIWIGACALGTGLWVGHRRSAWLRTGLIVVTLGGGVSLLCYGALTQGGWLPLAPPLLAMATTALAVQFTQPRSSLS